MDKRNPSSDRAGLILYELNSPLREMAMKYTQSTLDKLGDILGQSDYVVRYERGTFQSGWCLLEERSLIRKHTQSTCCSQLCLSCEY